MSREYTFRFKKFRVINDKTAMKVGTDGVLLGAWCDVSAATSVLDVGAGCGLIALMIAQRNDHAMIDAIDIDCCAVEEAYINFHDSPWGGRLNVREADFNIFANSCVKKYDLIVSNPPFFSNGVMPAGVSLIFYRTGAARNRKDSPHRLSASRALVKRRKKGYK